MEHIYENIEGWFDFQYIYSYAVNIFDSGSHFVEIGSWLGASTAYMAVEIINSNKIIRFDCIDPWESINEEVYDVKIKELKDNNITLYQKFLENIESVRNYINPIKDYSYNQFNKYSDNSIDFLFIDGAHDYESVKKDLKEWFIKVKDNGIIAGHDYLELDCPGVFNSVNEFFGKENVHPIGTSWLVYKNKIKKMNDRYGFSTIYNIVDEKKLEHYTNLIKWIVKLTNCKKYLEIGVNTGENIYSIRNEVDLCVGVDINDNVPDKNKIKFNLTSSDNFFANNLEMFDVIFIDGDHSFKQVKIDFENSLKSLNKYGIIVLHDTDPIENFLLDSGYCNDAYKIIDYIYVHHPELNVITFPIHETGLSVVMRKEDRRIFNNIEK